MTVKQRFQAIETGNTVRLKLVTSSPGAGYADPHAIEYVNIYKLHGTEKTDDNPLGRVLVQIVDADQIEHDGAGQYHIDLDLTRPLYASGRYQDEWVVVFEEGENARVVPMDFAVQPSTWFTDAQTLVHDYTFSFKPNRMPMGSKKSIEITISPDVPRGTDKQRYYLNMAMTGDLYISIKQICGKCMPKEEDLRLVVDRELVTERDGCHGFYRIDTTEFECGDYEVWFEASLGPNVYVSDREPFQIY